MDEDRYGDALERRARQTARRLLAPLPDRWRHTVTVARRARVLADSLDLPERHDVAAGAWLHDIGYAPDAEHSGFHPVDGARYLARRGWPAGVTELVAHHSGARFVAAVRASRDDLAPWPFRDTPAMDVLTYADQTSGPTGTVVDLEERMQEMLERHGPDSPNALAHSVRAPYLRAVRVRVETALRHPVRRGLQSAGF